MPVYVDPLFSTANLPPAQRRKWPYMEACHMFGTEDELQAIARQIGLKREWMDLRRPYFRHYDLTSGRRPRAIAAGAIEVDVRFMVAWADKRRFQFVFEKQGHALWEGKTLTDGGRCGGGYVCLQCGRFFYEHPVFEAVVDYADQPYLTRLCDDRLVKL